jgi:hypothetical protein
VLFLLAGASALWATMLLVDLGNNGIADGLQVLEVRLEVLALGIFVLLEPVLSLLKGLLDLVLVFGVNLVSQLLLIFNGVSHCVNVVFDGVLGVDLLLEGLVLVGELLGVTDHGLNLLFREATLVVSDSNGLRLSSSLLNCGY